MLSERVLKCSMYKPKTVISLPKRPLKCFMRWKFYAEPYNDSASLSPRTLKYSTYKPKTVHFHACLLCQSEPSNSCTRVLFRDNLYLLYVEFYNKVFLFNREYLNVLCSNLTVCFPMRENPYMFYVELLYCM